MNTTELIATVAKKLDLTQAKTHEAISAIFETIVETVKNNEEVSIKDFGKFSRRDRPARKGRNPSTGAEIAIEASKSLNFKVSKPVNARL